MPSLTTQHVLAGTGAAGAGRRRAGLRAAGGSAVGWGVSAAVMTGGSVHGRRPGDKRLRAGAGDLLLERTTLCE
jgi:hypothetical protein